MHAHDHKGSDVIEEKERLIAKLMRDVQSDRENSLGKTVSYVNFTQKKHKQGTGIVKLRRHVRVQVLSHNL